MTASPIVMTGATSPVRKLRWLGLWALTLAAALWVGSELRHDAAPRVVVERSPGRAALASAPAVPQARDGLGAAEIRTLLHDELARQLADLRRPAADAEAADHAPEPRPPAAMSDELAARLEEASRLVDQAIGAGRWTPDDRKRFSSATGELPPPALIELERKLHVAINRGAVAVVDGFPPFGHLMQAP